MSRKERRRYRRENSDWYLSAKSATSELAVALLMLKQGRHDDGLTMARYARKDVRWSRWRLRKQLGLA